MLRGFGAHRTPRVESVDISDMPRAWFTNVRRLARHHAFVTTVVTLVTKFCLLLVLGVLVCGWEWSRFDESFAHQPLTLTKVIAAGLAPTPLSTAIGFALFASALSSLALLRIVGRAERDASAEAQRLHERISALSDERRRTRDALLLGLAKLADTRDTDTGAHLTRIRRLTGILAGSLEERYPEIAGDVDTAGLDFASVLHDLGKVGIPDSILRKPGPLNYAERQLMRTHTELGAEVLRAIQAEMQDVDPTVELAIEIAESHHEWWNGNGYPHGLAEDAIPLSARIVALADVYDALRSERTYKSARSHRETRAQILASSGLQFDPRVVQAFLDVEAQFRGLYADDPRSRVPSAERVRATLSRHIRDEALETHHEGVGLPFGTARE